MAVMAALTAVLVGADGHRVAHSETGERFDRVVGPEARIEPHDDLAGGAGAPDAGDELVDETLRASGGVGRPFAHPGMEHFAGVGPGRQQRVVAQHLRVAESRALLLLPGDLAYGRVDIDDEAPCFRSRSQGPRPPEGLTDDGLELADVTEGEGPQERPQRRGGHDPEWQHPLGAARPQHVGVVDVGSAGHDGVNQRQDLAPRTGTADPIRHAHQPVHGGFEIETNGEDADQQQPGVATRFS